MLDVRPTWFWDVVPQRPLLDERAHCAFSPGFWASSFSPGLGGWKWFPGLHRLQMFKRYCNFKHSEHLGSFHCTLILCISGLVWILINNYGFLRMVLHCKS